jgi:hypothetical protein
MAPLRDVHGVALGLLFAAPHEPCPWDHAVVAALNEIHKTAPPR